MRVVRLGSRLPREVQSPRLEVSRPNWVKPGTTWCDLGAGPGVSPPGWTRNLLGSLPLNNVGLAMEEMGVVVLSLQVLCLQSPLQRNWDGASTSQVLWHVGGWKTTSLLLSPRYVERPWVTHMLWVLLPAMDLAWSWAPSHCSPSMLFGQSSGSAQVSCSSYACPASPCGHLRWLQAPVFWDCALALRCKPLPQRGQLHSCPPSLPAAGGVGPGLQPRAPCPSPRSFGVVSEAPWLPCLQKPGRGEGVG